MVNRSQEGVPLYRTFSELFGKGFSLDWGTIVFLVGVHTAAIALVARVFSASRLSTLVRSAWPLGFAGFETNALAVGVDLALVGGCGRTPSSSRPWRSTC